MGTISYVQGKVFVTPPQLIKDLSLKFKILRVIYAHLF